MASTNHVIVDSLAEALDSDDYDTVRSLLDEGVVYELGERTLYGREQVVASYRQASETALKLFDGVEYGHEILDETDATLRVRYLDRLTLGGERHDHHSIQEVTVGSEGRVIRIVDTPVPGQREAVDAFLARHGRSRQTETDQERSARHERERVEASERYERERVEAHDKHERERLEARERRAEE